MSRTDRLKRSAETFRQLTGITPVAFDHLLAELEPRYAAADAKRKDRPGRKRKPGAGRKHTLLLTDRLLLLLMYDRTRVVCPLGVKRAGDTAYIGTGLLTPRKEPRGGALTARQEAGNRRVSRRRIVVEHGIGKMKVWRIAAERYRNPRRRHTLMMKNIAGLHNLMFA